VGVGYAALVPTTELGVKAADDAADAKWWPIASLPLPLAFDHQRMLRDSLLRLAELGSAQGKEAGLVGSLRAAAERLEGPWRRE
jgi:8-oxo-dGTP diphosphatase